MSSLILRDCSGKLAFHDLHVTLRNHEKALAHFGNDLPAMLEGIVAINVPCCNNLTVCFPLANDKSEGNVLYYWFTQVVVVTGQSRFGEGDRATSLGEKQLR